MNSNNTRNNNENNNLTSNHCVKSFLTLCDFMSQILPIIGLILPSVIEYEEFLLPDANVDLNVQSPTSVNYLFNKNNINEHNINEHTASKYISKNTPKDYNFFWSSPQDFFYLTCMITAFTASSLFIIKSLEEPGRYNFDLQKNVASVSAFIDNLFLKRYFQIYTNILSHLGIGQDKISEGTDYELRNLNIPYFLPDNKNVLINNENLKDLNLQNDLSEIILFMLMKLMTCIGIDKKDTSWAFYTINKKNSEIYENFFLDDDRQIEIKMVEKIKNIPKHMLQKIFDTSIQEISEDFGCRFFLIHQHHSKHFYEILKNINFNFSFSDSFIAKNFVEVARFNQGNNAQYLSYGIILNSEFTRSLIASNNPPDEILDYILYCNDNLSIEIELINTIKNIKSYREEKNILQDKVPNANDCKKINTIIKNKVEKTKLKDIKWDCDHTLEISEKEIFKI